MNARLIINPNSFQYRKFALLSIILTTCFALGIILDIVESRVQNSSFYLSESVLFSFAWLLFLPLLYGQFVLADLSKTKISYTLFVLIPLVIHLLAYPAVVWMISKSFFNHTFSYWQTFNYGLTEYFFILLIAYSVPFILYSTFKSKLHLKQKYSVVKEQSKQNDSITTLVVSDYNKRTTINTNDILFLSANPPYINIHHKTKLYLHNETLKAILSKLDQRKFVRVHKSTIVNLKMVQSYKSRLNGDYDLTIINGTELRLSRIYAPLFKQKFETTHRVTLE
jgi:hypothetical protein